MITKYYYLGGQRVAMSQNGTVYYLHGDHLGSTNVVSGAAISRQTYYAYGLPRTTEGTLPTDRTFTGQVADSDGLIYYGARYYEAYLNRWTQPDSIIPNWYNPQSLNRYSYTMNNPVKYTDPTGHRVCEDVDCKETEPDLPSGNGGANGNNGNQDKSTESSGNNLQDPCSGTGCLRSPVFGQDPWTYRLKHTFTFTQANFECVDGICVVATSVDNVELVADITLSVGKGRSGGSTARIVIDPTEQTLKEMQLKVFFKMSDPLGLFYEPSPAFNLAEKSAFDFYKNPKDVPIGPVIDAVSSNDVRGGMPVEMTILGAIKPGYEFSSGPTFGYRSVTFPIPKLW